nr:DUF4157 domain-containing protein [Candidatus Accumulibacter sp. ACC007]
MRVSSPEDAGERQAERIADAVMAPHGCLGCTPEAPCASCASGIQRSAEGAGTLSASLPRARGRSLDRSARDFFEPRFGRDLGAVRVHQRIARRKHGALSALRAPSHSATTIVFAPGPATNPSPIPGAG